MKAEWPLVGRNRELHDLLRSISRRGSGGVLLCGEAGVGKTRLLEEAAGRGRDDGAAVEWVRATAAARDIPLGSFAHLCSAGDDVRDREDLLHSALRRLLERARPPAPLGDADHASAAQLLLVVDDAHLLDELSVALLHLVITQSPTRVLATLRTGGAEYPKGLIALWKDNLLVRIGLDRLPRDATEELVSAVLGDEAVPTVLDEIWRASRGNALVIRELLEATARSDVTTWDTALGARPAGAQERLRELVEDRLTALDPSVRTALEIVAVGEQVPLAVVEKLAGTDRIEALERTGLVEVVEYDVVSSVGMVQVTHPLYGEVLGACLSRVRRRSVLGDLARAGHALGGVDTLRLATWQLESGVPADPARLVELARDALGRLDHRLAERLATAGGETSRVDAGLVLGEALVGQERLAEANTVLAQLRPETPEHVARVAIALAHNWWRLNRSEEAIDTLRSASSTLTDHPPWQAECRSMLAQLLRYLFKYEEAGSIVEDLLIQEVPGAARVRAVNVAVALRGAAGRFEDALGLLNDEVLTLARRHTREVPFGEVQLRVAQFQVLTWLGRYHEMDAITASGAGFDVEASPPSLRAILAGLRGSALHYLGRVGDAVVEFQRALTLGESDWLGLRLICQALLCRTAATAGDTETAQAASREMDVQLARDAVSGVNVYPFIELSRAWLLAAQGARRQAAEHCQRVAAETEAHWLPASIQLLHSAARLGGEAAAVEPLERLARIADGSSVALAAAHARALVADDGPGLEQVAAEFAEHGADLVAAEAFQSARDAYLRQGRGTLARCADHRAEELLRGCGHPRSPGLAGPLLTGGLTRREREVAELAAADRTNQEIAEALYISVRTVETHLQRVYGKLGISSRQQLAETLT